MGRNVGVLSMVGACLAAVMSVNFLDLLQLNRCLLSIGKFLQLRFGPTDLLVVVPRNDAIFPKLSYIPTIAVTKNPKLT